MLQPAYILLVAVFVIVGIGIIDAAKVYAREHRWVCFSTNTRLLVSLLGNGCNTIYLLVVLEDNDLQLVFPVFNSICALLSGVALLFRIQHVRHRFKFFPTDESLRLVIFCLPFNILLSFYSFLKIDQARETVNLVAISQLVIYEMVTAINPWTVIDYLQFTRRPKLIVYSLGLGHISVILIATLEMWIIQSFPSDRDYLGWFLSVGLFLCMSYQLVLNNEYTNYFLANLDQNIESDADSMIHGTDLPTTSSGLLSKSYFCQENCNIGSLAGVEALNPFQLLVVGGIITMTAFPNLCKDQCSDLISALVLLCVILLLRMVLQQYAFTDVGSESPTAGTPYKKIRKCLPWVMTFLESWKGKIIIAAANFGINGTAFLISTLRDDALSSGILPHVTYGVSFLGMTICLYTFIARSSKWRKHLIKVLPSDDAMRLTTMLRALILVMKTSILFNQTTYMTWMDIMVLSLIALSMVAIGVSTTFDIRSYWKQYESIPVPRPRLLLFSFLFIFWWVQVDTMVISIVALKTNSIGFDSFATIVIQAASIFFAVILLNEITRFLEYLLNAKAEKTIMRVDSCMGILCYSPLALLFCAVGMAIAVSYSSLALAMFSTLPIGIFGIHFSMSKLEWTKYRVHNTELQEQLCER